MILVSPLGAVACLDLAYIDIVISDLGQPQRLPLGYE